MSGSVLNILLVEDNPDHAELLRRSLLLLPGAHNLHHVEDGEAAVDYVFGRGPFADRNRFPIPQLVLLDLRLPRLNGFEVLRHIKSHPEYRQVPIVVLTTSDAERDSAAAYEFHANGFITKPVDPLHLGQLIDTFRPPRPPVHPVFQSTQPPA